MLSEIIQTEVQISYDLTHMWSIYPSINQLSQTKQKQAHKYREESSGYQQASGEGRRQNGYKESTGWWQMETTLLLMRTCSAYGS